MLVLQETPAGFALFQVDDATVKAAEEKVRDCSWYQNFMIETILLLFNATALDIRGGLGVKSCFWRACRQDATTPRNLTNDDGMNCRMSGKISKPLIVRKRWQS